MGNIETTTKVSRLKSISSTEDNYLEGATGVFYKKSRCEIFCNIHGKSLLKRDSK